MTAHHYFLQLSLFLMLCLGNSCIDIPVELTLRQPVLYKESRIQKLVDDVRERLIQVDLSPDPASGAKVNAQDCKKVFSSWLQQQFQKGLIPKRIITPLEYAKGSTNPLLGQCKSINLDLEI